MNFDIDHIANNQGITEIILGSKTRQIKFKISHIGQIMLNVEAKVYLKESIKDGKKFLMPKEYLKEMEDNRNNFGIVLEKWVKNDIFQKENIKIDFKQLSSKISDNINEDHNISNFPKPSIIKNSFKNIFLKARSGTKNK